MASPLEGVNAGPCLRSSSRYVPLMTDTQFWILLLAIGVAIGTALYAARTAQAALRIAQGGGGSAPLAVGGGNRTDRKAAAKLAERANALLAKVNALPPALLGPGADQRLRDATLWTAAEAAALKETSPALLQLGAEAFASVEPALTWLHEKASAIQSTPRGRGEHLIDFPHETWRRHYQGALAGLQELVKMGEAGK